ncbi:MAG TPA: hypothetical protein VHX88_20510 [Solirubrobacteraceae bacterium]|nr:hypothetical protein [Solirubrobacteraceae bacterium]
MLSGHVSLRGPDGWRDLDPAAVVPFPVGPAGAHQLANRGSDAVRLLAISTSGGADVVIYPDEGRIAAAERRPGEVEYWRDVNPFSDARSR